MYCKKCGAQSSDDAEFCPKCGTIMKGYDSVQSKSRVTVGFTFAVISAVIYIIALLVMVPQVSHSYFYGTSGALGVVLVSGLSCLLSVVSLIVIAGAKKNLGKLNQLGLVGTIISVIVLIAGAITSIVFFIMGA